MKKRHQGAFDPAHPAPWEISRGWIEKAITCEACFWLKKAANVKEISIPSFNINTNTDILLKRDHDKYRGKGPSPIMISAGLGHLRPFEHPHLEFWTDSKQFGLSPKHFNTIHEETNILFGGGLDDVFENIETGELHIVDYKSTSQDGGNKTKPAPLDQSFLMPPEDPKKIDYKASYRRQAEMYQWILRRKGFQVSNTAYFLYVDGISRGLDGMLTDDDPHTAWMKFEAQIIPYVGDDNWVESALHKAKEIALRPLCPDHAKDCEAGRWFSAARRAAPARPRSVEDMRTLNAIKNCYLADDDEWVSFDDAYDGIAMTYLDGYWEVTDGMDLNNHWGGFDALDDSQKYQAFLDISKRAWLMKSVIDELIKEYNLDMYAQPYR